MLVEGLIKLVEKLIEAMVMKQKIEEKINREVENNREKKQVVNSRSLNMMRIVLANINVFDSRRKEDLAKTVKDINKLLDVPAPMKRTLS